MKANSKTLPEDYYIITGDTVTIESISNSLVSSITKKKTTYRSISDF